MRQYLAAKAAHPDALLFFRMGDFYELFFDDAACAAKALDLTLTSRNKGSDDPVPMAGVPHHAATAYIQRLLDQGFRVAICEQMADPATCKGIVPREVVRIATPAIAYDDSAIDARQNLYLVAIESDAISGRVGIAALDVSTGELRACEAESAAAALSEVVRLEPREVLVGQNSDALVMTIRQALARVSIRQASDGAERADASALSVPSASIAVASDPSQEAARILNAALGERSFETALDSGATLLGLMAAARCVRLASLCEPGRPLPIRRLVPYDLSDTLILDDAAQRHLELVRPIDGDSAGAGAMGKTRGEGTLLAAIDRTRTAPGARLLRQRLLAPRTHVPEIRRRLDAVEHFVTHPAVRAEVRARLDRIADIERLAVKVALERVGPRELVALRTSVAELPGLASALAAAPRAGLCATFDIEEQPNVDGRNAADAPALLDCVEDVSALLQASLADEPPLRVSDGGVIREGFDAELDSARTLARDGQRLLVELEARLREQSQIPSLKLRFTRVFGWYMEVTRTHLSKAPASWRRKQTVATGERFTCDELDELSDSLAHAQDRLASREAELFVDVVKTLGRHAERLRDLAARLAMLDVATALAELAHSHDYTRPAVDASSALVLEGARHPVVEQLAAAGRFVPNDVALDAAGAPSVAGDRARMWILTGPNMAGKSTFMRQTALAVVLAQMGSFVPARSAHIGVVDRLLTRVGASDNLARGQSTFMVEMQETANILKRASRRSLVILDEIGRGTSTYDGLSIAWAVAEYLHDAIGCRALFATHYHELTALAEKCVHVANYSVSAREHDGAVVFFHRVQQGPASRSYGVACAKLAGLPTPVLERAQAILSELEGGANAPETTGRPRRPSVSNAKKSNVPQLALFQERGADVATEPHVTPHPALAMLRQLDVDRMTPIEALTTLAKLKQLAPTS